MFIQYIADGYPEVMRIKLAMDYLNTPSPSSFYECFQPSKPKEVWDRFEFIYTPKHGS
ncbi:MAG: hypothetical protein AAGI25_10105 [Bacteroidota bacterium]